MTTPEKEELNLSKLITHVLQVCMTAAIVYVGTTVTTLNTTAATLGAEISAIKERLNKMDSEIVTRREFEAQLEGVQMQLNSLKDHDKVRNNR